VLLADASGAMNAARAAPDIAPDPSAASEGIASSAHRRLCCVNADFVACTDGSTLTAID